MKQVFASSQAKERVDARREAKAKQAKQAK